MQLSFYQIIKFLASIWNTTPQPQTVRINPRCFYYLKFTLTCPLPYTQSHLPSLNFVYIFPKITTSLQFSLKNYIIYDFLSICRILSLLGMLFPTVSGRYVAIQFPSNTNEPAIYLCNLNTFTIYDENILKFAPAYLTEFVCLWHTLTAVLAYFVLCVCVCVCKDKNILLH